MSKKKANGITLIALIITVIVMLILAGVAINLTVGDNGIFKKSDEGAKIYKNMVDNENESLTNVEKEMENLMSQYHKENLTAEMVSFTPEDVNWNVENVKQALDYLYNN